MGKIFFDFVLGENNPLVATAETENYGKISVELKDGKYVQVLTAYENPTKSKEIG